MSTPAALSRTILSVCLVVPLLAATPAAAQDAASPEAAPPGSVAKFDREQCLRAADRYGEALVDPLVRALRPDAAGKEIETAAAGLKQRLRDACTAAAALASEEARAAAEKLAAAAVEAMRKMAEAVDGVYRALPEEQKRKLDELGRGAALDELVRQFNDWLAQRERADKAPGAAPRALGRICFADRCFDIPGELDFGRSDRWRDDDRRRRE
jgi:hypothetical protein